MNRFIIIGEFHSKKEIRFVGENEQWQVQDFVISYRYGTKHMQFRMLQAVKGAIAQVNKMEPGMHVACTMLAKGRITDSSKVFNLDECIDICRLAEEEELKLDDHGGTEKV